MDRIRSSSPVANPASAKTASSSLNRNNSTDRVRSSSPPAKDNCELVGLSPAILMGKVQVAESELLQVKANVLSCLLQIEQERENIKLQWQLLRKEQAATAREAATVKLHRLAQIQLEEEKAATTKISSADLISLNFGGETTVKVKRSLLLQFQGSRLAEMFCGNRDEQIDRDGDGNVFIDYSASIMMPLVELLRTYRETGEGGQGASPKLPDFLRTCSAEKKQQWNAMVSSFGLPLKSTVTFEGVEQDLSIKDLHGWTLLSCEPLSQQSRLRGLGQAHIKACNKTLQGNALLVGVRKPSQDVLLFAAMGRFDVVLRSICASTTLPDTVHNGVTWSCSADHHLGFSFPWLSSILSEWEYMVFAGEAYFLDDENKASGLLPEEHTNLSDAPDPEDVPSPDLSSSFTDTRTILPLSSRTNPPILGGC